MSGLKQNKNNFSITKKSILSTISNYKGISVDKILSSKKDRSTVAARQLVIFFLKNELGMTTVEIAFFLGGKNHSTVIYALERIDNIIKKDKNFVRETNHIKELIYKRNTVKI